MGEKLEKQMKIIPKPTVIRLKIDFVLQPARTVSALKQIKAYLCRFI